MLSRAMRRLVYPVVISLFLPNSSRNSGIKKLENSTFRLTSDTIHGNDVLPHRLDRYNGVIIESQYIPDSKDGFLLLLRSSLSAWQSQGRRGVWLKLPIEKAEYIPLAVEEGFIFHHAEKNFIMMTTWLSEEENRMPAGATHHVGVGCVVVSPDNKMLLVQERSGPLKDTGVWKIPTGYVDPGEDIPAAACREVLEETGIEAEYVGVLCFRQAHNMLFGKSDLFFICVLKPKSSTITHQPSEIVACEWHEPSVYLEQPFFKQNPIYSKINELIADSISGGDKVIDNVKLEIGWRPGAQSLHFIRRDKQ